jgi:hypothetical protein
MTLESTCRPGPVPLDRARNLGIGIDLDSATDGSDSFF